MTVRAALVLAAVLTACAPRLELGARCTYTSECPVPYACVLGACRSACAGDRDCAGEASCLAVDGVGVCTLEGETGCATCTLLGLVCDGGLCRTGCATALDCLATQRCDGGRCVDRPLDAGVADAEIDAPIADVPGDAGARYPAPVVCSSDLECEGGELCGSDYGATVCRPRCTGPAECPPETACDAIRSRPLDGGYELACSTACVPGTREGCPPGTSCRMAFYSAFAGGPGAVTLCSGFTAGRGHGCRCENLDDSHECDRGASCEQPALGRQCLTICRIGDPCPVGVCEPTLRSVIRDGVEWGVCPATGAPIDCP